MVSTGVFGFAGVTNMEDRVAEVTVTIVLPEILPVVALMVAVPTATPVARPLLFTVATEALEEFQLTCGVISTLVPSEYMPVAANCWVTPTGRLGLAGVTAIETSVTGAVGGLPADELPVGGELPPPPPPQARNKTEKSIIIHRQFAPGFIVCSLGLKAIFQIWQFLQPTSMPIILQVPRNLATSTKLVPRFFLPATICGE